MNERKIEDDIINELPLDDQKIALDFVGYLHREKMNFVRDNGYWKDKIYYLIKFYNECICFIAIKDPDEKENRWTVWSDDMDSSLIGEFPIEKELKETAWKHIDFCGACGSCGGGRHKKIFGKVFDNVCGCTFRFDNPDASTLLLMKKIVEIRKKQILNID